MEIFDRSVWSILAIVDSWKRVKNQRKVGLKTILYQRHFICMFIGGLELEL